MSNVITTNTASLAAQRNLAGAQNALTTSVERLSSGLRINRAKDDAAGLGVSEALQKQINGVKQGIQNLNDGISLAQTAEGALASVAEIAQRMITLATQGANETLNATQKDAIKTEIGALRDSINDIAKRTNFTGTTLFAGAEIKLQVSNDSGDTVTVSTAALAKIKLTTTSGDTTTEGKALFDAIADLSSGITTAKMGVIQTKASDYLNAITTQRGALGAFQNARAQVSVAVTGVAGPTGGNVDKPVGTVWFAWCINGAVDAQKMFFPGDRAAVREATTAHALQGLLTRIA